MFEKTLAAIFLRWNSNGVSRRDRVHDHSLRRLRTSLNVPEGLAALFTLHFAALSGDAAQTRQTIQPITVHPKKKFAIAIEFACLFL
jgi:hypothetical protein